VESLIEVSHYAGNWIGALGVLEETKEISLNVMVDQEVKTCRF
jgi:hypothetical protein